MALPPHTRTHTHTYDKVHLKPRSINLERILITNVGNVIFKFFAVVAFFPSKNIKFNKKKTFN